MYLTTGKKNGFLKNIGTQDSKQMLTSAWGWGWLLADAFLVLGLAFRG